MLLRSPEIYTEHLPIRQLSENVNVRKILGLHMKIGYRLMEIKKLEKFMTFFRPPPLPSHVHQYLYQNPSKISAYILLF